MNEAKVTLSFPRGDTQRACIKIQDEASRAWVEVEMTMENFAVLISGQAAMPAEARSVQDLAEWGKRIETRTITLKDVPYLVSHNDAQATDLLLKHCPEGFAPSGYSKSQSGFVMHYKRWTKMEDATK